MSSCSSRNNPIYGFANVDQSTKDLSKDKSQWEGCEAFSIYLPYTPPPVQCTRMKAQIFKKEIIEAKYILCL